MEAGRPEWIAGLHGRGFRAKARQAAGGPLQRLLRAGGGPGRQLGPGELQRGAAAGRVVGARLGGVSGPCGGGWGWVCLSGAFWGVLGGGVGGGCSGSVRNPNRKQL